MKFVDKIKNALFEVEYVVDDKEKDNEDNEKTEETKENKDKPIAKRVILSGHRRDKHKENTENTNCLHKLLTETHVKEIWNE